MPQASSPAENASTTPPPGSAGLGPGTPSCSREITRLGGGPGIQMSPGVPAGRGPAKEGELGPSENPGCQEVSNWTCAFPGVEARPARTDKRTRIPLMAALPCRDRGLRLGAGPYHPAARYRSFYDTRGGTGVPRRGSRTVLQHEDAEQAEGPGETRLERSGRPRLGGEGPPLAGDREERLRQNPLGGDDVEALGPGPLVQPVGVVGRGGDLDRGTGGESLPEVEIEEAPRRFLEGEEEVEGPGGVEVEDPDVGPLLQREADPVPVPGASLREGGGGAPDSWHPLRDDGAVPESQGMSLREEEGDSEEHGGGCRQRARQERPGSESALPRDPGRFGEGPRLRLGHPPLQDGGRRAARNLPVRATGEVRDRARLGEPTAALRTAGEVLGDRPGGGPLARQEEIPFGGVPVHGFVP